MRTTYYESYAFMGRKFTKHIMIENIVFVWKQIFHNIEAIAVSSFALGPLKIYIESLNDIISNRLTEHWGDFAGQKSIFAQFFYV